MVRGVLLWPYNSTWTGVAVNNMLRDYRLFRANYGAVLQYWFLAQLAREKQLGDLQQYNSSFQTLGYSSERAIIGDTIIPSQTLAASGDPPRTNTCRECTSSRKQPSLSKQHPLWDQGRLRAGSETLTESSEVLLYCLVHYDSTRATLSNQIPHCSRWRRVGWPCRRCPENGNPLGPYHAPKRSVEFHDVKLLAPWRSPTTDRPWHPIISSRPRRHALRSSLLLL